MSDPKPAGTPEPDPMKPRKAGRPKLTRERLHRALANAAAFSDEVDEFGLGEARGENTVDYRCEVHQERPRDPNR